MAVGGFKTPTGSSTSSTAIIPYTAYLNTVSGNDSTAVLGDISKPYLTMTALIAALPATYDLTWTINITGATTAITMPVMPPRDLTFNADLRYIYDFNFNNATGNYCISIATRFFTYTFLNGNINLKSDNVAGRGLATAFQGNSFLVIRGIVNIIDWSNEGFNGTGVSLLNSELVINEVIKKTSGFGIYIGNPISLRIKKITYTAFQGTGVIRSNSASLSSLVTIDLISSATAATDVELIQAPITNLNLELKSIQIAGIFKISYQPTRLTLSDLTCSGTTTRLDLDAALITGKVVTDVQVFLVKLNSKTIQNLECKVVGNANNWGSTLTIDNCRLTVVDYLSRSATVGAKQVIFKGNNIITQLSTTLPLINLTIATNVYSIDVEGSLNLSTGTILTDQYGTINYITNAIPSFIGRTSALQSANYSV